MYHIYKVTNLVNNKIYIGQTTYDNPRIRFSQHKTTSKNHPKYRNRMVIEKAINKYGPDNFKFEVIKSYKNKNLEFLAKRETFYIKKFNSLVPNGYNVFLRCIGSTHTPQSKYLLALSRQGKKSKIRSSKFSGVSFVRKSWQCHIKKDGIPYVRSGFKSEIDAATAYDKMAIYLFKNDAKLNFPNKRYDKRELEECFVLFTTKRNIIGLGKYYSVRFCQNRPNRICYRAYFKNKHLACFKTPEEARDRVIKEYEENGLIYDENG